MRLGYFNFTMYIRVKGIKPSELQSIFRLERQIFVQNYEDKINNNLYK